MKIGGLQKTSLIEFPGLISCIVFTQGCNFICPYCYNPELVLPEKFTVPIKEELFFSFLKKRKKYLEGVVITGGEPSIQPDIIEFIRKIRDLGFKIKFDTNGSFPEIIETLLNEKLIDYISMDLKAPLENYKMIVGVEVDTSKIEKSIEMIKKSEIEYEFRTTVVKVQISMDDFYKIGKILKGAKKYFLQEFISTDKIVNPEFSKEKTYSKSEFEEIKKIMNGFVKYCEIR